MALSTARLSPPLVVPAIDTATGRPTQARIDYDQQVADQLADLRASQGRGVTDASEAAAGGIGEVLTASASGVSIGSGSATDVVTVGLTAGDWDVSGVVVFSPAGGATSTHLAVGCGTSTAIGTIRTDLSAPFPAGASQSLGSGMPLRINVAAATTAHLVALATHTSTMTVAGTITARRAR